MIERKDIIEDLNTEYNGINFQELSAPKDKSLRVDIIIFGISVRQEVNVIEAHEHVARPKHLKEKKQWWPNG